MTHILVAADLIEFGDVIAMGNDVFHVSRVRYIDEPNVVISTREGNQFVLNDEFPVRLLESEVF